MRFVKDIQDAFTLESRETGKAKLLLTLAAAAGHYFGDKAYEMPKIVK